MSERSCLHILRCEEGKALGAKALRAVGEGRHKIIVTCDCIEPVVKRAKSQEPRLRDEKFK